MEQAKFQMHPELPSIVVKTRTWCKGGKDFAGPFPLSERGKRYVHVGVDYFTRFKATEDRNANTAAGFFQELLDRYGVTRDLHTDQGGISLGNLVNL